MEKPFAFRMSLELSQKHLKYDDRQVVGSNELESGHEAFGFERSIRNVGIGEKALVSIRRSTIAEVS
jgi:hypothetical protein